MHSLGEAIAALLIAVLSYTAPGTSPAAAVHWAVTPDVEARAEHWDRLAECESTGRWAINTRNGYYGGVQFHPTSWRAVGGKGLPHEWSRHEQIYRAELLFSLQGAMAWPGCHTIRGALPYWFRPLR